ncbi:MAG: ade, partial [Solirubrobacterales bacterium]|nr:ade [Solirubrobacterales bacterium]
VAEGAGTVPAPAGAPLRLPERVDVAAARLAAEALPAMGFLDGRLLTERVEDPGEDTALLLALDRHTGRRAAAARVSGFGLRTGALATTVAHDHHNLLVLGADDASIAAAIAAARGTHGGMWVTRGDELLAALELPLAGLMSDRPAEQVATALRAVIAAARGLGCRARDPLMALSFLGLEVIPELKLTDHGLIDVVSGRNLGGAFAT